MSQDRNIAAEVFKPLEKATDGFGSILAVEVFATQVVVLGAVAKHVVRGGEHGSSHGKDGFLGSAARLDAEELRSQVAGLHAHCGPGGRDQGGLDPGAALSHASRSALAGALVAAWTQAGPGDQMARTREARHVHADLRHYDAG